MSVDIAVIHYNKNFYFARSSRDCLPLRSAPVLLIQGIHGRYPELARSILRTRIFTTVPANALLNGMVKVAAKRATYSLPENATELSPAPQEIPIEITARGLEMPKPSASIAIHDESLSDAEWLERAFELKRAVQREGALHQLDRAVAALLVSAEGKCLGSALNTNARDKTRHAELNLIDAYQARTGQMLPSGVKIISTLKPCKMCAGAILCSAEIPGDIRVFYGEDDPGPHGQNTALDRHASKIQFQIEPPFNGRSQI